LRKNRGRLSVTAADRLRKLNIGYAAARVVKRARTEGRCIKGNRSRGKPRR